MVTCRTLTPDTLGSTPSNPTMKLIVLYKIPQGGDPDCQDSIIFNTDWEAPITELVNLIDNCMTDIRVTSKN